MAALALLFSYTPAAKRLEDQYALGLLYKLRGALSPPPGAIVVAIDDQTIERLREAAGEPDKYPWLFCLPVTERSNLGQIRGPNSLPRALHACLLDQLRLVGFRVVAFDVLFSAQGAQQDDAMFASALRAHGATAILSGVERSTVRKGGAELVVERKVQPLAQLNESAASTGAFLVPRSGGPVHGYLRKIPGFEEIPSLPDETIRLWSKISGSTPSDVDAPAFQYLWLYGPPGSIETVSAIDVLSGEEPDTLRSAASSTVAFVGASDPNASDYPDSFPAFFHNGIGADISGVELLATAFLNLRQQQTPRVLSSVAGSALTSTFAFVLGFLARGRSGQALFAVPIAGVVYLLSAGFAFSHWRLLVPLGTPLFVVAPIAFIVAVFARYRLARALIMRLAPAPAARRMLSKPTGERGEAIEHDATVVFFDLIGSTAIAEKISPVDFNALLNAYFDNVAKIVESQHGEISAFSGDGITVVFTGARDRRGHAMRACTSVVSIVEAMRNTNAKSIKAGLPALHMRMGVNSGSVAEGEIGARDRFNFSVVGDAVNLAARLEQMGKTLFPGVSDVVLVGETTYDLAREAGLTFVDCGFCTIRGRERPERVYRLEIG